jgi:hypothetical protein
VACSMLNFTFTFILVSPSSGYSDRTNKNFLLKFRFSMQILLLWLNLRKRMVETLKILYKQNRLEEWWRERKKGGVLFALVW